MQVSLALLNPLTWLALIKSKVDYWFYLYDKETARQFKDKYIPPSVNGGNVLDFGCGMGRHCAMLSQLGFVVTGVDKVRYSYWKKIKGGIFFDGGDSDLRHLEGGCFDLCLSFLVLYLVKDDVAVIRELYRVLKPMGWLVMQVTNRDNYWTARTGKYLSNIEDVQRYYTIDGIRGLLESVGFKVAKVWTERFYSPYCVGLVNSIVSVLLPQFVIDFLSRRTPEQRRGLINVWVQKVA